MDRKGKKTGDIKCNSTLQTNLSTSSIKGRFIMNFKTGIRIVSKTMMKKQLPDSERAGELPVQTGSTISVN